VRRSGNGPRAYLLTLPPEVLEELRANIDKVKRRMAVHRSLEFSGVGDLPSTQSPAEPMAEHPGDPWRSASDQAEFWGYGGRP
jgi:hypothetical protein